MYFNLKVLRPVSGSDKNSEGPCPHCGKLPIGHNSSANNQSDDPLSLSEVARQLQGKFRDIITPTEWWSDVKPHLSLENVFKFGKFLIVLLLAAVSGAGNLLLHLAGHTNRFVHALSGFMKSATPFLLGLLDSVNRLFAGFFTLIAMIWRDARRPQVTPQQISAQLAHERNQAKQKFLEGPKYPYRRDVNRPYL